MRQKRNRIDAETSQGMKVIDAETGQERKVPDAQKGQGMNVIDAEMTQERKVTDATVRQEGNIVDAATKQEGNIIDAETRQETNVTSAETRLEINGTEAEMRREKSIAEIETRQKRSFVSKLYCYVFWIHFILIALLVIALTVRGFLSSGSHNFHPRRWYIPVLASTACAGILGFVWQEFALLGPSKAIKTAFWLSPLLTCGFGIISVLIGTPGSLAISVIALISSVIQSLYACWVSPRFEPAIKVITVSITYHPPKVIATVIISIIVATLYLAFLVAGIGGATVTKTKIDILFIIIILGSLAWTMQIVKNLIQVTVSHIMYMQFTRGIEVDFMTVLKNTVRYSMGTICIGSVLIPILSVIRGIARAVNLISGDVDEFMFSCANCCSGVESGIVMYGNRWGFLHVGVYNKGIVKASMDTWEIFRSAGMEKLINADLTSSFCFLSGVAAGSVCGLLGASWAYVVQRTYATEISIYTFLMGYFMGRVAIAWVQASVTAYYVSYAENPEGQQFDTTIPTFKRVLERLSA